MKDTNDCCPKITGEHLTSRSILKVYADKQGKVGTAGHRWQTKTQLFHIDALKPKVLCKRHNEWLSPLDAAVSQFFTRLYLLSKMKSSEHEEKLVVVNGFDLSRWIVQRAMAHLASDNATLNKKPVTLTEPLRKAAIRALTQNQWPIGGGLYLLDAPPHAQETENAVILSRDVPVGFRYCLMRLGFAALWDGRTVDGLNPLAFMPTEPVAFWVATGIGRLVIRWD